MPPVVPAPQEPHYAPFSDRPRGITYVHHPDNPHPFHENTTSILNIPIWYPKSRSDPNMVPFSFNGLFPFATATFNGKPSASGPFPIVVLVPEAGQYPESYYETAEMLAAANFVVVGAKPYFELFMGKVWKPLVNNDPLGMAYMSYLRPRAIARALHGLYNATDGVRKNNVLRGIVDLSKPITLVGHGMGAAAALAAGGMVMNPCARQPFPTPDEKVGEIWANATLCKRFLDMVGYTNPDAPLNFTQPNIGAVVALEPGAALSYLDPESNSQFSWFTQESFSSFDHPLLIVSMQGSGDAAVSSRAGFDQLNATAPRGFVQFYNGTNDDFFALCELAHFYPDKYAADLVECQKVQRPAITLLQYEAALYVAEFANLTMKCERSKIWTTDVDLNVVSEQVLFHWDAIPCRPPSEAPPSALVTVLVICSAALVVFIGLFAMAAFIGRNPAEVELPIPQAIPTTKKSPSSNMLEVIDHDATEDEESESDTLLPPNRR